jgi:hypothetical protein
VHGFREKVPQEEPPDVVACVPNTDIFRVVKAALEGAVKV